MPALATVGSPRPEPAQRRRRRAHLSLASKAAALGVIFFVVPVILYDQFHAADEQKRELVMDGVRDQGRLVAVAITPVLTAPGQPNMPAIERELARFANDLITIKLLYHPTSGAQGFYYVASSTPLLHEDFDTERAELKQQGVLDRLEETCAGDVPIALRYRAPDGHEEVVTSLAPVKSAAGCWAVVTSLSASAAPGVSLGVPYYETPEVKLAAIIYLAMAVLTFTTFWSIWRGLLHFQERARAIRSRGAASPSFVARNDVPELDGVAEEFDRMVETLQNAARDLRRAAEDNAHAFKTPVAIIRQSLEPVARAVAPENTRALRAVGLIERSLDKLDGLVASSRRLDEATADLLDTPRGDLDLSSTVDHVLACHSELFRQRGLQLRAVIEGGVVIRASEDMVETVIENVLENAVSFSPPNHPIAVKLSVSGDQAVLAIADEGPGVREADLPRVFDRYFSSRASAPDGEDEGVHFGVGLWIVRRNVEALGGRVSAENRDPHGLAVRIQLPLKRPGRDLGGDSVRRTAVAQK